VLITLRPAGRPTSRDACSPNICRATIDGHPNIIVQNMDGAGGVVGATYLGEVAPKDGKLSRYLSGTSWVYVSEPERWRVDFKSYEFVAYQTRHHGAFRAHRRRARHEGACRHREGEGLIAGA